MPSELLARPTAHTYVISSAARYVRIAATEHGPITNDPELVIPDDTERHAAAIAEYERDGDQDRTGSRACIEAWNHHTYYAEWTETRTVTNGIGRPCTFAGSFKRQLHAWANAGCAVAEALQNPNNTHNGKCDYIAARAGTLSYLPAGRTHVTNDDGTWSRQNRQEAKAAKVIASILMPHARARFTEADIDAFTTFAKTASDEPESTTIRLVPAADIPYWYHEDRIATHEDTYTLGCSCMRYPECQDYVAAYADLPHVQLAILTDASGYLHGRALVWQTREGLTYMDRAYGTTETQARFATFAAEQGWYRKTYQTYDNKTDITTPSGAREWSALSVDFGFPEYYPYTDTFSYYDPNTGIATNDEDDTAWQYQLSDTGGGYDERQAYASCEQCGSDLDEDDVCLSPSGYHYCERCWSQHWFQCEHCGEAHHVDEQHTNPITDAAWCYDCMTKRFTLCDACGEWHRHSDTQHVRGETYCDTCFADRFAHCQNCEAPAELDELTEHDGSLVCPNCATVESEAIA